MLQIFFVELQINHHFLERFFVNDINVFFYMLFCVGDMERRLQNISTASFPLFLIID